MYRGTTPVLIYELDTDLDLTTLEQVWVTIKGSKTTLTKELKDLNVDDTDKTISIFLTQEETLEFPSGDCEVQMRLLDNSGSAYVTPIERIRMERILKDGVIDG